jgi:hypothetical protein
MKFKPKLKLLAIIVVLEMLYFYLIYFILLFSFFLYFGSGASAESQTANNVGKMANLLLILPPIIFNFFKLYQLNFNKDSEKRGVYIFATVFNLAFISSQIYFEFLNF